MVHFANFWLGAYSQNTERVWKEEFRVNGYSAGKMTESPFLSDRAFWRQGRTRIGTAVRPQRLCNLESFAHLHCNTLYSPSTSSLCYHGTLLLSKGVAMTHWRFVFASRDCAGATDISNKRKKVVESVGDIVGNLINIDPGHVTDTGQYRIFYGAVKEILKVLENPNPHHKKLKKAYASPQLPESRSSKMSVAFTIVDSPYCHCSCDSKIVELAKTAQGNKDEALSLSKHTEDVRKRLLKRPDRAKNVPPEALAEIGKDIQLLQSFPVDILSARLRLQSRRGIVSRRFYSLKTTRMMHFVHSRLTNSLALRIDVSRLRNDVFNITQTQFRYRQG
ncbi:hypothetical protein Moror_13314 [Moniliophthora roreri MCA 2997]|uniref:Uncharacterized protein n=1 Tax=Moniliophthora roreri (strain MCA 2997) TaxID=1381753 RepID=V2WCU7_MONRO|nr:hypothetical protein Moror_13314 [Moniliophthora roreri MCA 2997]